MRPLLRSGEWVGVDWCARGKLPAVRSGDLVLGRHADQVWLVHRLVAQWPEGGFMLKGDASTVSEQLGSEEIWGRVVAIRKLGEGGRARRLETNWLDRLIARVSRVKLRRTVYFLGLVRRSFLR
jgi:hypothetical protein